MTLESLQELMAELARVDKARIDASSSMGSLLGGSLGRARLDAALRHRMNVCNPDTYRAKTFGELCQILGVSSEDEAAPPPVPPAAASRSESPARSARIGIDIESIAALPEASDYWEHEFYRDKFTFQEVAYAQLQPHPRETLAVMWCAKEAARKSCPDYAHLGWNALEVVHDEAGQPGLVVAGNPASGTLSLSHTSRLAIAVFVAAAPAQLVSPSRENPNPGSRPLDNSRPVRSKTAWIAWLAAILSIISLVVSLLHK